MFLIGRLVGSSRELLIQFAAQLVGLVACLVCRWQGRGNKFKLAGALPSLPLKEILSLTAIINCNLTNQLASGLKPLSP